MESLESEVHLRLSRELSDELDRSAGLPFAKRIARLPACWQTVAARERKAVSLIWEPFRRQVQ